MSGRTLASEPCSGDKAHQSGRVGKAIVAEADDDALRPRLQLFDMGAAAQYLHADQNHQLLDLVRHGAEAVDHFRGKAFDLGLVVERGQTTVELQAQVEILDIMSGDGDRRAERDQWRPSFFRRLAAARLERGDGLVQHLLVKLVADFLDMSGLFVAEQIAGAANVEIVAGELEARSERVERLQHFEPLLRLRRDGAC